MARAGMFALTFCMSEMVSPDHATGPVILKGIAVPGVLLTIVTPVKVCMAWTMCDVLACSVNFPLIIFSKL